ncbi:DUF6608 family protein [Alkaliphilus oremlandii]|uniref:DUF4293 family protein n=1 Tax=Alkaliphilus oremlandii (strain OhILAs) TaxID=350688 RepID=A8MI99_ALKOO|nr:DUF6608 family protein [Alkaliphilus oremlandii]ABW19531.1 hypothetical protein Clos_1994 [Alkaliphilus oremlandii OhILAs]
MKTRQKIISVISYICILFTITTVISSIRQLTQGIEYDTNSHILLRMAICIIAIIFIVIFKKIRIRNIYLRALVQYILSTGCIFLLIYFLGFFTELSKTAYRDVFLNYTIPFIIIATVIIFKSKRKTDKQALDV